MAWQGSAGQDRCEDRGGQLRPQVEEAPPAVARCAIIWSAALLSSSLMGGLFLGLRFSTKSCGVRPSVVRTNTSAPASMSACTTGVAALSTAQCRGEYPSKSCTTGVVYSTRAGTAMAARTYLRVHFGTARNEQLADAKMVHCSSCMQCSVAISVNCVDELRNE